MTRSQGILLLLLAGQLAVVGVMRPWERVERTTVVPTPLVPELEAEAPVGIEIDGDGSSLTLERRGEAWTLPQLGGYPVEGSKVDALLERVAAARAGRPVVSKARHHRALGLGPDEYARRVLLSFETGEEVELLVGSSPDPRRAYVRRSESDDVHEAAGLAKYDLSPEARSWIERQLVEVELTDIASVSVANARGGFEIVRAGDGWVVERPAALAGSPVPRGAANRLARAAASVWIAEPVGSIDEEAQQLASPAVTWSILHGAEAGALVDSSAALETRVRVGSLVPGALPEQRFAVSSDLDFAVAVTDKQVRELIEASIGTLLAQQ